MRHKNRFAFTIEKVANNTRLPLHQNHNSFLHSNYHPGTTFINAMNQLTHFTRE